MEINKNLPIHYRYESHSNPNGVIIKLRKFYPVRETECFYFVVNSYEVLDNGNLIYVDPKTRRVSKKSYAGYCFPTKKQALESFKARQVKRVWHAEYSLALASQALLVLDQVDVGEFDELNVGTPEFLKDIIWY